MTDHPLLAFLGSTRPVNVTPGWTLTPSRRHTLRRMDCKIRIPEERSTQHEYGNLINLCMPECSLAPGSLSNMREKRNLGARLA